VWGRCSVNCRNERATHPAGDPLSPWPRPCSAVAKQHRHTARSPGTPGAVRPVQGQQRFDRTAQHHHRPGARWPDDGSVRRSGGQIPHRAGPPLTSRPSSTPCSPSAAWPASPAALTMPQLSCSFPRGMGCKRAPIPYSQDTTRSPPWRFKTAQRLLRRAPVH
jgi:hypothetical protein